MELSADKKLLAKLIQQPHFDPFQRRIREEYGEQELNVRQIARLYAELELQFNRHVKKVQHDLLVQFKRDVQKVHDIGYYRKWLVGSPKNGPVFPSFESLQRNAPLSSSVHCTRLFDVGVVFI